MTVITIVVIIMFPMSAAILCLRLRFVVEKIIGLVLLVQDLLCAEQSWDSKLWLGRVWTESRPQVGGRHKLELMSFCDQIVTLNL